MRKDRFYIKDIEKKIIDDPSLLHKIRNVLRKRKGEPIFLFDGKGCEYKALISKFRSQKIELEKIELVKKLTPVFRLSLGFSLLKSKRSDFIFQKATELGISEFIPLVYKNTVVRKLTSAKIKHFKRIVIESASQSGRLFIPEIRELSEFSGLIKKIKSWDIALVALPYSSFSVRDLFKANLLDKGKNILLLVGPEGGFSSQELEELRAIDSVYFVNLSIFTLRAETASIFLVGLVSSLLNRDED